MKLKRTLFIFIALIFAVCVSCAFLAGCADNETNKDEVSDVDDNILDTDFDYSLVTGDEIFNEGVTLEELKEYFADVTNYTLLFESEYEKDGKQIDDKEYYVFGDNGWLSGVSVGWEKDGEILGYHDKSVAFVQNGYLYSYSYDHNYSDPEKYGPDGELEIGLEKMLAIYSYSVEQLLGQLLDDWLHDWLQQGDYGLEFNEESMRDEYLNQEKYTISSYVNPKGNLLELGYTVEGNPGTEYEGVIIENCEVKVYGINSTRIEIPDVDLSTATWSDTVYYNGIWYRKDTDSDGNEYYYVDSSSSAEPETTINTLPVKPREN